jgi:hypothetical protein
VSWKPTFYWTGEPALDAVLINRPHVEKEGPSEDRTEATLRALELVEALDEFTLQDALNLQNLFLSQNNWKGIAPGLRTHNVKFSRGQEEKDPETPDHSDVPLAVGPLFPVSCTGREELLSWYERVQKVHPLSDLNGRVFGVIVSSLYSKNKRDGK